jgi:hypothetical protein
MRRERSAEQRKKDLIAFHRWYAIKNWTDFLGGLTIISMFIIFCISVFIGDFLLGPMIAGVIILINMGVIKFFNIIYEATIPGINPYFIGGSGGGSCDYQSEPTPFRELEKWPSMTKQCPDCHGTGRCQYCGGTGKRGWTGKVAMSPNDCMQCLGWGVCPKCHGKGIV